MKSPSGTKRTLQHPSSVFSFLNSRPWILLFAIAVLLRVLFVLIQVYFHPFVIEFYADDSAAYDRIATSLIEGKGYALNGIPTAYEPPTYPIFLAGLFLLFGRNFLFVSLMQAFLGAATVLLIYGLGSLLFSRKVGVLAGLLMAVYPHHIFWTGYILTETLYVFLLVLALYLFVRFSRTVQLLPLIGACAALIAAILTRPVFVAALPLLVAWLAYVYSVRRIHLSKVLMQVALVLVLFIVVFLPWGYRNYRQFDAWMFTSSKSVDMLAVLTSPSFKGGTGGYITNGIDFAFPPELDVANLSERDHWQRYGELARQQFRTDPMRVFRHIPQSLWNMWRPNYAGASLRNQLFLVPLYLVVLIGGIWGIVDIVRSLHLRRMPGVLLLLGALLYSVLIHALLGGMIRFRLPIEPLLIIFAASVFVSRYDQWKSHGGFLEPYLQRQRMRRVIPLIPRNAVVLDLGCGVDATLLSALHSRIKKGVGIDLRPPHVRSSKLHPKLHFIAQKIQKELPLKSSAFTHVVCLGAFGYFEHGKKILEELYRVLRPDGQLLFTVPMPLNRHIMAVLKYFGMLDRNLVERIRHYYTINQLRSLLGEIGFVNIRFKKFQFGLNCVVIAEHP